MITPRIVEVDQLSVRVVTAGLENRDEGEPLVVFKHGSGGQVESWDSILPAVAQFAPAVAYERPGAGQSTWDSLPPTPARVNSHLHALLTKISAEPPYILVGHSWGGALARYFAGRHPEDVAGVLYLDPTVVTMTPADEVAVFESIGADADDRAAFYRLQEEWLVSAPAPLRSEAAVLLEILRDGADPGSVPPQPPVPTTIIVPGRPGEIPSEVSLPFDGEELARAILESRTEALRGWMPEGKGGQFLVAGNSGHAIHRDEPTLVIDAIRHLVEVAR